ncbi:MAG: bifunctional 5,10-methylenetetrahydrofolate dehydrogenase/5,10-methenyltetrahydrofolate cyclohydrolase [Candidatus Vogelbacteria bacterium]|nr:bifunctional 5,10-methylenetetrahydrofolate dehydrogenase/5,10-methenyltetrahydrofolate cyclohydrolase [Candidatus Vogelbacteria bacterium]
MIIDGRKLAAEIGQELATDFSKLSPVILAVIMVGENKATYSFVAQKERFAAKIGVEVRLFEYDKKVTKSELLKVVDRLAQDKKITGIIIQLPLPSHIDQELITNAVPASKDVDALGNEPVVDSPVAAAVLEILARYHIKLAGQKAVVVGQGKLVGQPVSLALARAGALVVTTDIKTKNLIEELSTADIVVSGTGMPGLIKPEMIKGGVVIIDAGTSEVGQVVQGDALPACANKAALFTPVPGGVGPITVAMLFKNLLQLANRVV